MSDLIKFDLVEGMPTYSWQKYRSEWSARKSERKAHSWLSRLFHYHKYTQLKLWIVLVLHYPLRREFGTSNDFVSMCVTLGMSQIPIDIVVAAKQTWMRKRKFHGAKRLAVVRRDSHNWALHYVGRQKSCANVGTLRRNFFGRLTVVLNRARQLDTSACVYIRREIWLSSGCYIKKLNNIKINISVGEDGFCPITT